jgi:hypothetical protein
MGAAEIQQQHKGPSPETAAMTGNQEKSQWSPETDPRAEERRTNSRVFCQDLKNEWQDLVEEPAAAQAKEETAHSLRDGDVGAQIRKEENGTTSIDYSGWIALRREQSGMSTESRNRLIRRDVCY